MYISSYALRILYLNMVQYGNQMVILHSIQIRTFFIYSVIIMTVRHVCHHDYNHVIMTVPCLSS